MMNKGGSKMKKFITFALALVLLLSCACAEDIDLSGLSFDQLVALKQKVNQALWASDEFQEVSVPPGVWIGGEDIPVGRWTVTCSQKWGKIEFGDKLKENGQDVEHTKARGYIYIRSEDTDIPEYATETYLDVYEGMFIVINFIPMVFSTYTGKPDLGFK